MRVLLRVVDFINERVGKVTRWLAVIMVLLVSLEVIMRYFFNAPTMWNYETTMFVGGSLFALSLAYTHLCRSHIRIDMIYSLLSPRKKAIIDVLGAILFFYPLAILLVSTSVYYASQAWVTNEKSIETYWYPPIAPFRSVVAVGFCLFALQGTAHFIRDLYLLVKKRPYD